MPTYGVLVGGVEPSDAAAYAAAYTEAVRTVMFSTGILTLLAAPIAWFADRRGATRSTDGLAAPGRARRRLRPRSAADEQVRAASRSGR